MLKYVKFGIGSNQQKTGTATHIPGIFNIEAHKQSRVQEEKTEWMLSETTLMILRVQISKTKSICKKFQV